MHNQHLEIHPHRYPSVWNAGAVESVALGNVMVEQTIKKIPDPLSRFILKLTVEGWPPQEIAEHVGIPTKDVQVRLNQARECLRATVSTWQHAY